MKLDAAACGTFAQVTPVLLLAAYLSDKFLTQSARSPLPVRLYMAVAIVFITASIACALYGVGNGGTDNEWVATIIWGGPALTLGPLIVDPIWQLFEKPAVADADSGAGHREGQQRGQESELDDSGPGDPTRDVQDGSEGEGAETGADGDASESK